MSRPMYTAVKLKDGSIARIGAQRVTQDGIEYMEVWRTEPEHRDRRAGLYKIERFERDERGNVGVRALERFFEAGS